MKKTQLEAWEREARDAADQLCLMVEKSVPADISINTVGADGADGTNSLDVEFVARLERREHLTDDFLADA